MKPVVDQIVAVVIPAYRVAGQIGRVISNIPAFVRYVIVVDDASPDESVRRIEPLLSQRVRLVRHRANQGVGGAMLTGYAVALELGADIVVKMDGDDQMDPAQLPRLLAPLLRSEADYAKGNRFMHQHALGQMPALRRVGNLGLSFLTKIASGYWNIFDPTNGYTAIHRRVLQLLDPDAVSRRYFFEASMLLDLRRLGAVVQDVPMPARYADETSSLSIRRALLSFPLKLLGGLLRRLGQQYYRHDVTAASVLLLLGLPLLLFGTIWGAVHWAIGLRTGVATPTGTVLLAVLPIILGVQFLLQALALDIDSVPTKPLQSWSNTDDELPHPRSMATYLQSQPDLLSDDERAAG